MVPSVMVDLLGCGGGTLRAARARRHVSATRTRVGRERERLWRLSYIAQRLTTGPQPFKILYD